MDARPYSHVIETLRGASLRPTRQRIALAKLLFGDGHRHVTAESLQADAQEAAIRVSMATVYNTLRQFTDAGLFVKNSRGFFKDKGQYAFEVDSLKHPDLEAATLYLFMIEIHTGNVFHKEFRWISDVLTVMGMLMVVTGPILWWRRKW